MTVSSLLLGWGATSRAQDQPPAPTGFDTPRQLALGSGTRASALSTSALAVNPAGLAFGSLYHLEGVVDYLPGRDVMALQAGVVDSMTSRLGAGLGVRGYVGTGPDAFTGIDVRGGFGFPLAENFSVGVAGRYVHLERDGTTASGNPIREDLAKGLTFDAAMRLTLFDALHLAALGYNLLPLRSDLAPVMVGGSAAFQATDELSMGGDVLVDLTTSFDGRPALLAGGGLEYLAGGVLPMRAGYRFDVGRGVHSITAGLGYLDQTIGIDLSLRQDLGGHGSGTQLMAAFRYFIQ